MARALSAAARLIGQFQNSDGFRSLSAIGWLPLDIITKDLQPRDEKSRPVMMDEATKGC